MDFRSHTTNSVSVLALSLALIGGSHSGTAIAQDSTDSVAGDADEVITVTARKRGDESLQDIGGSIQAISGADLAAKAATGFDDYARRVPGLSANNSGTGQTQITIRGAASTRLNHANPNIPSTAGVYFDETAVTASGFNPDAGLVDINRIEVLRGPQGTLFGASAMSGVIRIIPNAPEFDEFSATAGFAAYITKNGSESVNADVTVNIPIADRIAVRMSGYVNHKGGYIDNVYSGPANVGRDDYNTEDIYGLRGAALWEPMETLSITLSGLYQQINADGRPDEYRRNDPLEGLGLNSRTSNGGNILFPEESVSISDELQVAKFIDETFDDELALISLKGEKDFGVIAVTSVTSYMQRDFMNLLDDTYRSRDWVNQANFNWWDIDGDGSPTFTPGTGVEGLLNIGADPLDPQQSVPVYRSPFENNTQLDRFAQEIRAVSDFDGPFNFLLGFYYEDESRDFQQDIILPGLDAWLESFCDFCTTPAFGAERADNFFEGRYSFDTTQVAVFGEASVAYGDFELIAGGRYFDYEQDADVFFGGFIEFSEDRLVDTIEEDGFSPKVELLYKPTDDLTFFGGYSEGFRLGSVQQFISGACTGDLQALGVIGADGGPEDIPTTIESDSLNNYEVGVKATLLGGSTTVNVTGYHIDWDGARSQVFLGCGWILEGNFVDIESQGLEFNMTSRINDNVSVFANIGYTDSEVVDVAPGAEAIASPGDRTPMVPEVTASFGIEYFAPDLLLNEFDVFFGADVSYIGDMVSSLGSGAEQANQGFITNLTIPSNTVLNMNVGIGTEQWTVSLFARNVTDARVITGVDIDRRGPAAFSRARPRNIGINVRGQF